MAVLRYPRRVYSASAYPGTAARQRTATLWLLAGWLAFLLFSSLQVCCKLSAAEREPPAAGAAIHTSADHGHADHQPTDHQDICADIILAADTAAAAPQRTIYDGDAAVADLGPDSYSARHVVYTGHRHCALPQPASFHRRTARILI